MIISMMILIMNSDNPTIRRVMVMATEEPKKFEFPDGGCCSHCGAKEYTREEIVDKNPGPGDFVRTHIFCTCVGCARVFRDPVKYCRSSEKTEKLSEDERKEKQKLVDNMVLGGISLR